MQVSDSISNNPANSLQGLGKTCMYCGDGINDLAALAAADVGMAVGASDASAAATLSDTHYSIAGKPGQLLQYQTPVVLCWRSFMHMLRNKPIFGLRIGGALG